MANNPIVTFTMENGDTFKAELYPDVAPQSVNNFVSLIKKGFYDGLIFHRVIPGFMIQEETRKEQEWAVQDILSRASLQATDSGTILSTQRVYCRWRAV